MFKLLKKIKHYMVAFFTYKFDENADPRIQLEQALNEAKDQHGRLKETAASVIANQKSTEMRLNTRLAEVEKIKANIRQAIQMAHDATAKGETDTAAEYENASQTFAGQLVAAEAEVASLQAQWHAAVENANNAKQTVQQNAIVLQEKITQKRSLVSKLDQAKLQEATNAAMKSLSETIGGDVPSLAEVEDKINDRYAKALGHAELQADSVEGKMQEIENATRNMSAISRLEQMKAEVLGPQEALTTGAAAPVVQIPEQSTVNN
jgi:phage shock protein A